MQATVAFKPSVSYRRDAFEAGLKRLGYTITGAPSRTPGPKDVLVTWNRGIYDEQFARAYEGAAILLVAENGYMGSDEQGHKLFALAKKHHNGAGEWTSGQGEERGRRLIETLKPWRSSGDFLLVLPQRSIGEQGIAMPRNWSWEVSQRLRKMTSRPIKVRPHPGAPRPDPYDALSGAHAAITWGSGAGIKALWAGFPVFHDLPCWIGAPAARALRGADIEDPFLGDRMPMFQRLAWAQWSIKEIESGEAFAWLLH